MAEITKVTTPLIPRENLGSKNKPISDQAFELTDPTKVQRPGQEGKILDQQRDGQSALHDSVGREMLAPLLRPATEMLHAFQKLTVLLQMGISTSEIANNAEVRALLESLYLQPEQLAQALQEQDGASVLFKSATFDLLRDIMAKFPDQPKVRDAMAGLLKTFEQNVNTENSVKTILLTCKNLLDYMFSGDRAQFAQYLEGLGEMLLPQQPQTAQPKDAQQQPPQGLVPGQGQENPPAGQSTTAPPNQNQPAAAGQPAHTAQPEQTQQTQAQAQQAGAAAGQDRALGVDQREAAQVLKGNLLPLLGEIVVKYNQNERIRDMVMVVVHNIVRVDQGTPEALRDAIAKLAHELAQVANLPESFEKNLQDAVRQAVQQAKGANSETMEKLASILSETLSSPTANAATVRQAETLLMSLLQNQSTAMNVLHFVLPMQTEQGKLFAELYVDPDSDEKVGRSQERSRKLFLAFESDSLGAFELSFVESDHRVDFSMWCPQMLVQGLGGIKRQVSDIMQVHGYTMNSYQVAELTAPKSIADVFPRLMDRRMGVDVRI